MEGKLAAIVTCVLAVSEASAALYYKNGFPMTEAAAQIQEFLRLGEIAVVSITCLSAFEKQGRHR